MELGEYHAPLFLAWQVTNRCEANCLHCCEESGPDKAWKGELTREEGLKLAREAGELQIPHSAFGGGEPLSVPWIWEIFDALHAGGVGLKIETNGYHIDEKAADHFAKLDTDCIQISLEGADAASHNKVRPNASFERAVRAAKLCAERGMPPEIVYVPTKLNLDQAEKVFDLAAELGARSLVTGPMMRLGRAAQAWSSLALSEAEWTDLEGRLEAKEKEHGGAVELRSYPWDIVEEVRVRAIRPQAMVLVVPDGKVKLLNALPFYGGDLRKESLQSAWEGCKRAWASAEVQDFCRRLQDDKDLLLHANETWAVGPVPA